MRQCAEIGLATRRQAANGSAELLKAVKKTRIPDEIVSQIFQLVQDGALKPGDRLPSERELAQQFNVSRASVREAMRLLDMKRLVVIRPGAGTFITEDTSESILQAFSSLLNGDGEEDTAGDVFEMRLLLEPRIASLSAQRATDLDVSLMKEILDAQDAEIVAGGTGVEFDTEFHFAIARATKNSALVAATQAISDILTRSRELAILSRDRSLISLQSHRQILSAIEMRQHEEAEEAMREHITKIDREANNLEGGDHGGNCR